MILSPVQLEAIRQGEPVRLHEAGADVVVLRADIYERMRDTQPYSLTLHTPSGTTQRFGMFATLPGTPGSFWNYRQIGAKLALINWPGNDSRAHTIVDPEREEAKRLSLGFLYWLQTECPRDDGGRAIARGVVEHAGPDARVLLRQHAADGPLQQLRPAIGGDEDGDLATAGECHPGTTRLRKPSGDAVIMILSVIAVSISG